jgi:hypothetical protein
MAQMKMMNAEEVEAFRKPVKKKRGRRTEIQDATKENAEPVIHRVKTHRSTDYDVSVSDLRTIMDETVWRVLREINPGIPENDYARINSDELSYVLMLTMICGAGLDGAGAIKIRETTVAGQGFCKEHE